MTRTQLAALVGDTLAQKWHAAIHAAMIRYGIDTPLRQSHFYAQILHESASLQHTREIWGPTAQQLKYDPPGLLAERLGNEIPGDGQRYRGRGLLMLTGKANYNRYSIGRGVNVVTQPDRVALIDYAADSAGWYWRDKGINRHADNDDLIAVTKAINGGTIGIESRAEWLRRVKELLEPRWPHTVGVFDALVLHGLTLGDVLALAKSVAKREGRVVLRGRFPVTRAPMSSLPGEKLNIRRDK